MTPQAKLSALLDGTRQPRTQEKGLPYFTVIEKPKIVEKVVMMPGQRRDWYPVVLMLVTAGLVFGLIAFNLFGWPILDKLGR